MLSLRNVYHTDKSLFSLLRIYVKTNNLFEIRTVKVEGCINDTDFTENKILESGYGTQYYIELSNVILMLK